MLSVNRKKIENWFLHKAFSTRTPIQAETLEAMFASFLWLLEKIDDVEIDIEFCLVHYDLFSLDDYDSRITELLEEAWETGLDSNEGDESDCDCHEIDMSELYEQ